MTPLIHADKVAVDASADCWLWTGALDKDGYAIVRVRRPDGSWTCRKAHRVMFEHHKGPIPDGHQLDHVCNTRRCVNPAHAEPVLGSVNLQRVHARWLGEVAMTDEQLRGIHARVSAGEPLGKIAASFGCSKGELVGVIRGTPYRRMLERGTHAQGDLLAVPHPDDDYLPAYLR